MRKTVFAVVLVLFGTASILATGVGSAGALAGCDVAWGSLPETTQPFGLSEAPITNVRAGRHACFDRLVIDVSGPVGGYDVRYIPQIAEDAEGLFVPLRGGAFLGVHVGNPGHDSNHQPTYRPPNPTEAVDVSGYQTFRHVQWGGTFEGESDLAVGVRARLPFRVSRWQSSPTSGVLVLDVAHGW